MTTFTARFKYPVYLTSLLVLVASVVAFYYFAYFIYERLTEFGFTAINLLTIIVGWGILAYTGINMLYNVVTYRYGIELSDEAIILKDHLFFTQKNITNKIKGFSASTAKNNNIKTTILYLNNNTVINFHFNYIYNHAYLEPALFKFHIKFLGNENYKAANIIGRHYKFK